MLVDVAIISTFGFCRELDYVGVEKSYLGFVLV